MGDTFRLVVVSSAGGRHPTRRWRNEFRGTSKRTNSERSFRQFSLLSLDSPAPVGRPISGKGRLWRRKAVGGQLTLGAMRPSRACAAHATRPLFGRARARNTLSIGDAQQAVVGCCANWRRLNGRPARQPTACTWPSTVAHFGGVRRLKPN